MFNAVKYLEKWAKDGGDDCEIYERFTLVSCSSPLLLLDDFTYLDDVILNIPRILVFRETDTPNYYKVVCSKGKPPVVKRVNGVARTLIDFS